MFQKPGCMRIITAQMKERKLLKFPPVPLGYMWVISEGMDQLPTDQQHIRAFCGRTWQNEMVRLAQEIPEVEKKKYLVVKETLQYKWRAKCRRSHTPGLCLDAS